MGRWSCLFIKRNSNPTLYQYSLSDSSFYCSHLLRSDLSRWINWWEKNDSMFHWFVPPFLCDLIISRFFKKNNWHSVWNFEAFFVQCVELYCENEFWGLQCEIFVIYWKCWGLGKALFFVLFEYLFEYLRKIRSKYWQIWEKEYNYSLHHACYALCYHL